MSRPFADSWDKLDWGNQHLKKLKSLLKRAFDPDDHPIAIYPHVARRPGVSLFVTVFSVEAFPQPPPETGLMVGDIIHNFRSALDHMTWELVQLCGQMPKGESARRQIQFPLSPSFSAFKGRFSDRMPGVSKELQTLVQRYQPYRRGDQPRAMRVLQRFSDTDKHRVVVPAVTTPAEVDLTITGTDCSIVERDLLFKGWRALKHGTPLLLVSALDDRGLVGQGKVNVQGHFEAYPTFSRGVPIDKSLTYIAATIAKILSQIEDIL